MGLVLAGLIVIFFTPELTQTQIEVLAREQGMIFPEEALPFNLTTNGGEEN